MFKANGYGWMPDVEAFFCVFYLYLTFEFVFELALAS